MKKRPLSVTIIAWFLIVMGGMSLILIIEMISDTNVRDSMSRSTIPIPVQYAMSYISMSIMIVSGIAILKKCNWARFLYVVWSTIGFVHGLITSPMKAMMIPGLVVFMVTTFFLFRPNANEYFLPLDSALSRRETNWSWSFVKGIGWALSVGVGALFGVKNTLARSVAFGDDYSPLLFVFGAAGSALWLGGLHRIKKQGDEQDANIQERVADMQEPKNNREELED